MTPVLAILAGLTLGSAIAAMTLRNLIHCALSLAVCFAGLACIYLYLDAQFLGFVQVLVYIGAVAILIVFAILLTRGSEGPGRAAFSSSWLAGLAVAVAVFVVLAASILGSRSLAGSAGTGPQPTVAQIGQSLMTEHVLPLQVIGVLLTSALIGAVIIALNEKGGRRS